jgi:hypothetical protein
MYMDYVEISGPLKKAKDKAPPTKAKAFEETLRSLHCTPSLGVTIAIEICNCNCNQQCQSAPDTNSSVLQAPT